MQASSALTQLCQLAELWEMICSNLTGDSLITMSQVNIFAHATAMTPAFQLLAGLTSDSVVVEWRDPTNIFSQKFEPTTALSKFRQVSLAHDFARAQTARNTAQFLLRQMISPYQPQYDQNSDADTVRLHHCLQGPARPPTPQQANVTLFQYTLFDTTEIFAVKGAAVFGIGKGFMFPPYWRALCYGGDDSVPPRCSYDSDDDYDENDEVASSTDDGHQP